MAMIMRTLSAYTINVVAYYIAREQGEEPNGVASPLPCMRENRSHRHRTTRGCREAPHLRRKRFFRRVPGERVTR
jgi:hypothetical protein